jgi:hypothetical protein
VGRNWKAEDRWQKSEVRRGRIKRKRKITTGGAGGGAFKKKRERLQVCNLSLGF